MLQTTHNVFVHAGEHLLFSKHGWERMCERSLSKESITAVLDYGRTIYTRNAMIFVIGKKEIKHFRKRGINLRKYEVIHVVCSVEDGTIITVYRNKDFRSLRSKRSGH